MTDATVSDYDAAAFDIGPLARRSSASLPALAVATALAVVAPLGAWMFEAGPAKTPVPPPGFGSRLTVAPAQATRSDAPRRAAATELAALLDPALTLGVPPVSIDAAAPLGPNFVAPAGATRDVTAEAEPVRVPPDRAAPPAGPQVQLAEAPAGALPQAAVPEASPLVSALPAAVPLPTPRPIESRASEPRIAALQGPSRRWSRGFARPVEAAAATPDNRTFLEKFFGMLRPSGPVLAYATPEETGLGNVLGRRGSASDSAPAAPDRWTAVYDIAAHTVYMPNGARLEAHSGLGARLDDPRHVHERNVGATPPHLYDLQPREQLFHGVQALRLNPIGEGSVFGRDGLLAHSYMLGPNGDSNGCVSFRDYNAFLRAYQNGEVKRLVVVPRLI